MSIDQESNMILITN